MSILGDTTAVKKEGRTRVYLNLTVPLELIGRSAEFQRMIGILTDDGDILIAGVPGCGRRTLARGAAKEVGAKILEVDCIRATDGTRFLQIIADAIATEFDLNLIKDWVETQGKEFFLVDVVASIKVAEETAETPGNQEEQALKSLAVGKLRLKRGLNSEQLWQAFDLLIKLPQQLIFPSDQRVVLILHSFPHIRSWDKGGQWEAKLRSEINQQTHVSYVLIATIAEINNQQEFNDHPLEVVELFPLGRDTIAVWAREILHAANLTFEPRSPALSIFCDAVQGHIGDALVLIRRLQNARSHNGIITEQDVKLAIETTLKDLSTVFESMLILLPPNQVHLLEALACDPTEKPQSKEYIQKHGLSRGGSLQGALTGLQHKGLIYGAEQKYQLALPLLALWLRQSLI